MHLAPLKQLILDKSQPYRHVSRTVNKHTLWSSCICSAQNSHDSQITCCKDLTAIKELLPGAWIQPSPHSRFTVSRTGNKQGRPESGISLDQNRKSACSPGNSLQSNLFNIGNKFFHFWQSHYIFSGGEELNLPHYSPVPNLEWKPALWQNVIHFSYIPCKQLDSHHKILKPNIVVGSFWVSRLGVAPSMSKMNWKCYIFKARQLVNSHTVIFSLKPSKQFFKSL